VKVKLDVNTAYFSCRSFKKNVNISGFVQKEFVAIRLVYWLLQVPVNNFQGLNES